MKVYGLCIFLLNVYFIFCDDNSLSFRNDIITVKSYVFWPNATIPFYIDPEHFDHEQSLAIMTALSMFAFKTCLKFIPVMTPPVGASRALVFINPDGKRRCVISTDGHSVFEPHTVILGYDCLKSPNIDMMIMKALGFPFEHNRASRDLYIEVLLENVEPGAIDLFTKEPKLPLELRSLPYDVNSVMHFGNRDYSKNGHRTMIFKDHKLQQNRVGLTTTDLRKIELVYGPECLKRDRQEKIDLCQSYPGVARRKRSLDVEANKSLRVNPDITPPPEANGTAVDEILKELGIEEDAQKIVDDVNKIASLALSNARAKYCNTSKPDLRIGNVETNRSADILGIVEMVTEYAKNMVENALTNLTEFCEDSKSIDIYQRACPYYDQAGRCKYNYYKSTKSGNVRYSTQHRPVIKQSTRVPPRVIKQYAYARTGQENETQTEISKEENHDIEVKKDRRKRHVDDRDNYSTRGLARRFKKDRIRKREVITDLVTTNDEKNDLRMGTTVRSFKKGFREGRRLSDARKSRVKKSQLTTPESDVESDQSNEMTTKAQVRIEKKDFGRIKERFKKAKIVTTTESDVEDTNASEDVIQKVEVKKVVKKGVDIGKLKEKQEKLVNKAKVVMKERSVVGVPKTIPLSKANQEFYNERKWPGGVVIYLISRVKTRQYDLNAMRQRLQEVDDILRSKTCVRLKEIFNKEVKNYTDYLLIDTSPDYVTGRVGGKQNFGSVEMFRGDQHRQHTAMMVMAMLGFYFEVARHDRDKYIRVHMRHIRPDKLHHFEKIREDATFALPYDYRSATHPAWQFWRKIGKIGISSVATYKDQDPAGTIMKSLGQNQQLLSDLDIVKINSVYGVKCFKGGKKRDRIESESE